MDARALGPLSISPVGVGTAPIGSDRSWYVYWGAQDERAAVAAIHRAIDAGVNWIDTAPFYGWGRGEEIVGRALRGRREDVLVFTKCGTFRNADGSSFMNLRPESIRAEIDDILRRLQVDSVDLLQLHDVDTDTPIEETWAAVQGLIGAGKVRHGGISNHPADDVERALAVGPVTALQYEYSLLRRSVETQIVPFAQRHGIGLLCWSPLASGFVTAEFDIDSLEADDFRRRHPFAHLDLSSLRRVLADVGRAHGRSSAQVAIAWLLQRPAVAGVIVGVRNESEAEELPGAADLRLSADELAAIEAAAP